MTTDQINVRDPFVLCHNGTYYLYGTDSATTWHGRPDGFSCWTSQDLNDWQGPFQVFSPDESFCDTQRRGADTNGLGLH